MVRNGRALLQTPPIKNMLETKERHNGVSHGLAEVGYDIRLKQNVHFEPKCQLNDGPSIVTVDGITEEGRFCIASTIEEFHMPNDLYGVVHDKSTWARHGLSVFNTVIEPGWRGFLTLELVLHSCKDLFIPAGTGIAQVIFHELTCPASYVGKYQDQADRPIEPLMDPQPDN